jgi:hypothetical protein
MQRFRIGPRDLYKTKTRHAGRIWLDSEDVLQREDLDDLVQT